MTCHCVDVETTKQNVPLLDDVKLFTVLDN